MYLSFEYISGDNTIPGGSLDGTAYGAVSVEPGVSGNALYIKGDADSKIYLGDRRDSCFWYPELCVNGYTIAYWLKIGSKVGYELYFISNGGQRGLSYGIAFMLKLQSSLLYLYKQHSVWWKMECVVTKETWLHVAFVWSNTTGGKAFLNGQKCDEDAIGEANTRHSTIYNGYYFGKSNKRPTSEQHAGEAIFDELLFWPEDKSDGFISSLYDMYDTSKGMIYQHE